MKTQSVFAASQSQSGFVMAQIVVPEDVADRHEDKLQDTKRRFSRAKSASVAPRDCE